MSAGRGVTKRYIVSKMYGYFESDTITDDTVYFAEVKTIPAHENGVYKRTSVCSKAAQECLRVMMYANDVQRNPNYVREV